MEKKYKANGTITIKFTFFEKEIKESAGTLLKRWEMEKMITKEISENLNVPILNIRKETNLEIGRLHFETEISKLTPIFDFESKMFTKDGELTKAFFDAITPLKELTYLDDHYGMKGIRIDEFKLKTAKGKKILENVSKKLARNLGEANALMEILEAHQDQTEKKIYKSSMDGKGDTELAKFLDATSGGQISDNFARVVVYQPTMMSTAIYNGKAIYEKIYGKKSHPMLTADGIKSMAKKNIVSNGFYILLKMAIFYNDKVNAPNRLGKKTSAKAKAKK